MIDKLGRNIDCLHISLTNKCNLDCVYCTLSETTLSFDEIKFIIKSMSEMGIKKIKFTQGEPLLFEKLIDLIIFAKDKCGIEDVVIMTNAITLCEKVDVLKNVGIKSIDIAINSLKEYRYKSLTGSTLLKDVLKSIELCLQNDIKVSLNVLAIDGFNDDEIIDFINMSMYYPLDINFYELKSEGYPKNLFKNGYINIRDYIEKIDGMASLNVKEKSISSYYKYKNSKGTISVISPINESFCKLCRVITITCDGYLKLCQNSNRVIDIKNFINKPLMFREAMKEILQHDK